MRPPTLSTMSAIILSPTPITTFPTRRSVSRQTSTSARGASQSIISIPCTSRQIYLLAGSGVSSDSFVDGQKFSHGLSESVSRTENGEQDTITLGFTVNIGISHSRLLAKMASDFRKPDRVHTLYRQEIPEKMWPLPVSDLFFVGPATAKKLFSMGLSTIGDLAAADPAWLKAVLKKQGETLWGFARGIDLSPVLASPAPNKGYGNSTTTPFDVTDRETADLVLLALSETLGSRLRADGAKVSVVSVGIRYADLSYFSHQRALVSPTDLTLEIYHAARELFPELWDGRPIRHLGVHTGGARYGACGRQMSLFDEIDYEKLAVVDRTVDALRQRFGRDSVKRAPFLNTPVSHMCGGVGA